MSSALVLARRQTPLQKQFGPQQERNRIEQM
jgi:hypothetical protein